MLQEKGYCKHFCYCRLCFEKISFAFHPFLLLFNWNLRLMSPYCERLLGLFLVNWGAELVRLEELFHEGRLSTLQAFVPLITNLPRLSCGCVFDSVGCGSQGTLPPLVSPTRPRQSLRKPREMYTCAATGRVEDLWVFHRSLWFQPWREVQGLILMASEAWELMEAHFFVSQAMK